MEKTYLSVLSERLERYSPAYQREIAKKLAKKIAAEGTVIDDSYIPSKEPEKRLFAALGINTSVDVLSVQIKETEEQVRAIIEEVIEAEKLESKQKLEREQLEAFEWLTEMGITEEVVIDAMERAAQTIFGADSLEEVIVFSTRIKNDPIREQQHNDCITSMKEEGYALRGDQTFDAEVDRDMRDLMNEEFERRAIDELVNDPRVNDIVRSYISSGKFDIDFTRSWEIRTNNWCKESRALELVICRIIAPNEKKVIDNFRESTHN